MFRCGFYIIASADLRSNKKKDESQPQPIAKAESEKQTDFPDAEQSVQELADSCVTQTSYRYNDCLPEIVKAIEQSEELRDMWSHLKQVKANPHLGINDLWFEENVEEFAKHNEILAYIEYYYNLTDLFVHNLPKSERNIELQKKLVSVFKQEKEVNIYKRYSPNFGNILCCYLCRFDLAPQIKAVIFQDERFKVINCIYHAYRCNK